MPPRSRAPISSSSAFRSALAARSPRKSARIFRPAPSSPMSARSRARCYATWPRTLPPGVHFIPAHPVAGTEHSGPDAGFAELFVNRWCILTPPQNADKAAVERLAAFWRALGANVESMPADHHDLVLGITSHLPHLIAYTIVGTADELSEVTRSEVLKFSAGGFRDFTRIAASDPTMWRDVFLANKDAVLEMLDRFNKDLSAAHARHAERRRPGAVRPFHPHARHPPRHRRDRPGFAGARFRPRASDPAGGSAGTSAITEKISIAAALGRAGSARASPCRR